MCVIVIESARGEVRYEYLFSYPTRIASRYKIMQDILTNGPIILMTVSEPSHDIPCERLSKYYSAYENCSEPQQRLGAENLSFL